MANNRFYGKAFGDPCDDILGVARSAYPQYEWYLSDTCPNNFIMQFCFRYEPNRVAMFGIDRRDGAEMTDAEYENMILTRASMAIEDLRMLVMTEGKNAVAAD